MNRNRYEPEPGFKDLGLNRTEPNRTVGVLDFLNNAEIKWSRKVPFGVAQDSKRIQEGTKRDSKRIPKRIQKGFKSEY